MEKSSPESERPRCAGLCSRCPRAGECPTRRASGASPVLLAGSAPSGSARGRDGAGFAVDVGSTTLALALYDLRTGSLLSARGCMNPQRSVSADVIGRIAAASTPDSLAHLGRIVEDAVGALLREACSEAGVAASAVRDGVATGNTVMLHLLTGHDPAPLGRVPFRAEWLAGCDSSLLGIPVWLPPCIGAFVGADHVCSLVSARMSPDGPTALLCDLGTNAEVALRAGGAIFATSTAAGPAFEGTGVRGSDLLDAIAGFCADGTISETGASDETRLVLADGRRLANADVRAVQVAKAAVAAGISVMLDAAGVSAQDLAEMFLAGGFGCGLNPDSAAAIGMLPDVPSARKTPLGNAALAGAAELLLFPEMRDYALDLARSVRLVELGGNADFSERFIDAMTFAPWR